MREIAYGHYFGEAFFVDVSGTLEIAQADVVGGERVPELTYLVNVALNALT